MSAILNSLNAHNFLICQQILMTKFVVYRALTDKTCLLLGLWSPLRNDLCQPFKTLYQLAVKPSLKMFDCYAPTHQFQIE